MWRGILEALVSSGPVPPFEAYYETLLAEGNSDWPSVEEARRDYRGMIESRLA